MDKREQAAIAYTGVHGCMKNEPAAYKRMCFRDGWDAAIAALEPAPVSVHEAARVVVDAYDSGAIVAFGPDTLRALAEKGEA